MEARKKRAMIKDELITKLQKLEQHNNQRSHTWGSQRYAGRADAYRVAISLVKQLNVPCVEKDQQPICEEKQMSNIKYQDMKCKKCGEYKAEFADPKELTTENTDELLFSSSPSLCPLCFWDYRSKHEISGISRAKAKLFYKKVEIELELKKLKDERANLDNEIEKKEEQLGEIYKANNSLYYFDKYLADDYSLIDKLKSN